MLCLPHEGRALPHSRNKHVAISPNETARFGAGKSKTREKHTSVRNDVEGEEKRAKILLGKAEKKRAVGETASLERIDVARWR